MQDEMQVKINQFAVDVCRLVCQIEQIGWHDDPRDRIPALQKARDRYEQLLQREYTLALSPDDTFMIETMLVRIKARLRFLG
ncbi:MAG TPA: hypothetical protein VJU82_08035 [Acidobacteriaceae bacterium]|nr:hypothetical protein [Acidobacteriaceae bacterium]